MGSGIIVCIHLHGILRNLPIIPTNGRESPILIEEDHGVEVLRIGQIGGRIEMRPPLLIFLIVDLLPGEVEIVGEGLEDAAPQQSCELVSTHVVCTVRTEFLPDGMIQQIVGNPSGKIRYILIQRALEPLTEPICVAQILLGDGKPRYLHGILGRGKRFFLLSFHRCGKGFLYTGDILDRFFLSCFLTRGFHRNRIHIIDMQYRAGIRVEVGRCRNLTDHGRILFVAINETGETTEEFLVDGIGSGNVFHFLFGLLSFFEFNGLYILGFLGCLLEHFLGPIADIHVFRRFIDIHCWHILHFFITVF